MEYTMGPVNLIDLADALDNVSSNARFYLDLASGEVIETDSSVIDFIEANLDLLLETDDEDTGIKTLIQKDLDGQYDLCEISELAEGYENTLALIEPLSSQERYEITVEYVDSEEDEKIRNILYVVLKSNDTSNIFEECLAVIGQLRDYHDFRENEVYYKAMEWCDERNIPYDR